MTRPPPSLRSRALAWLAQREHSRTELRRKLLRAAQRPPRAGAVDAGTKSAGSAAHEMGPVSAGPADGDVADVAAIRAAVVTQVDQLLEALSSEGLLSEQRFIDSRVRVRAAGHGARRIEHELARHGLKLPAAQQQRLRDSELQRAAELWRRRFGSVAGDERERARQARFLAGRGFSGEVIRRVLASAGAMPDDDATFEPV